MLQWFKILESGWKPLWAFAPAGLLGFWHYPDSPNTFSR